MAKPDEKIKAIELRQVERLSIRDIADTLNVSRAAVSRWLRLYPLTKEELRLRYSGKDDSGRFRGELRDVAIKQGLKYYVSQSTCLNGHVNPRRMTTTGSCMECRRTRELRRLQREHKDCPEKLMWKSARWRAQQSGVPFTISVEDVKAVWPVGNRCPVLDIELRVNEGKRGAIPNSPSLDRLIPEMGYVVGNIAVISHKANSLKRDETDPDIFRAVADWVEKCKNLREK